MKKKLAIEEEIKELQLALDMEYDKPSSTSNTLRVEQIQGLMKLAKALQADLKDLRRSLTQVKDRTQEKVVVYGPARPK